MTIKMSDVFGVSLNKETLNSNTALVLFGPNREAAEVAILNHDHLQAENERLREALELADGFMRGLEHKFDIGYVGYPTQSKITEALKGDENE